jgi:hypothetical protein
LIYLEREIYIFLSLLSGRVAHLILTAALSEYGDPQARIYRYTVDRHLISIFFQQLKILVRGVGRVGSVQDVKLLKQIAAHCDELAELDGTSENERSIVRISEWVENIIRSFSASGLQATTPHGVSA